MPVHPYLPDQGAQHLPVRDRIQLIPGIDPLHLGLPCGEGVVGFLGLTEPRLQVPPALLQFGALSLGVLAQLFEDGEGDLPLTGTAPNAGEFPRL